MITLPDHISIGDKYGPAMEIVDQADADAYFAACVEHAMRSGESREQAERIERFILHDYAGYYGPEVQRRVERLYRAPHSVLGSCDQEGWSDDSQ